ncbi:MAG: hypothetical protein CUN56_12090 [Phototrophicales bacterium]|nr:MAG: hypothetical protein CUN56_12090 [Phototrophicales bacterium]RMG70179.1 MAG: hypothetical protein D6711_18020 [Chloroflexota bacterium]
MSIFSDEWRRCLREQYKHVIRNQDNITKASLTVVLNQLGFGEDELKQLELEATIRTEDTPDDFKPNLDILQSQPPTPPKQAATFQPHPAECQCPSCVNINLTPHDEDGQPITPEQDDDDDDSPTQMSLF